MKTSRYPSAITLAGLLASVSTAQIQEPGDPTAVWADLRTEAVPVHFVQPPDVPAYMAEDEANGYRPLRNGALIPTPIGQDTDGLWETAPDGSMVWRFGITSPGAYSIGLEFDGFWLPEGAQVYMYDPSLTTILGAYGSINNQPNSQILMEPFPGDTVIFEYVQPADVSEQPLLHLGTVIYDYRDVITLQDMPTLPQQGDGGCLVNVNCSEGDSWEVQKRATVRTLSGGALCSGALINNTANDGTAYVYTASHCGQGSNTTFRFNYQTANCGGGGAPTGQNVSGATVLENSSTYDSRLLRINNTIPANYNPYFAGWTRTTQNPTFAFAMGHPSGGTKKISIDFSGATKSGGNMWFVDWDLGMLEGGSSGGPLFDQNGLIRGAACCVNNFACGAQVSWFGRFDRFWATQPVAQWLDPVGLNSTTLDGFDPQNPGSGGGGATDIDIQQVSPASISVVNPDPVVLTLTGDGFAGTNKVTVDGVELAAFPPAFTVVSNTELKITLPQFDSLGAKTIVVEDSGSSDSTSITVTVNAQPTLDLASSSGFLLSAIGAELYMGSLPTDTMFLLASPNLGATSLPGLFDAGIGNGDLASLVYLGAFTVDPATGQAAITVPFGLPTGFVLHFQALRLSGVLPSLPLDATNIETGTVLL